MIVLKIGFDRKPKLLDEKLFKDADRILFIKNQHCFFIFHSINGSERNGAVLIGNQNGVANDTCCPFVAIVERLDIRKKYQC
jgi:hypothetical protein